MGEVTSTPVDAPGMVSQRLAITGAAGFIGRETVAGSVREGHRVLAILRPGSDTSRVADLKGIGANVATCGLDDRASLATALGGCNTVIHLAVSRAPEDEQAIAETVGATRCLIEAMRKAGVRRLVMASSFAVYDYEAIPVHGVVTESSPIVPANGARDWYCRAKVLEEKVARDAAGSGDVEISILRLGAVYGPGRLWTGRLGAKAGRCWLCIGSDAEVPVLYVGSAAECLLRAATVDRLPPSPLNVLDDAAPTQRLLRREIAMRLHPRPVIIVVPWACARLLGRTASALASVMPVAQRGLPALLRPPQQAARFKPLRYTNAACREALGWHSRHSLADALDQSVARQLPGATVGVKSTGVVV